MIKVWIREYKPSNEQEILSALGEIMQEIALAGLSRTNFLYLICIVIWFVIYIVSVKQK